MTIDRNLTAPLDERSTPTRRALHGAHVLLILLLMVAALGTTLHAQDEHHAGEACGLCLAGSHGGVGALPDVVAVAVSRPRLPCSRMADSRAGVCFTASYEARAPPR